MQTRTTILLDADLLERLTRHAHRTRTTKTALITTALERYLEASGDEPELAFIAVGESSHGRLSLDGRRIAARESGRRSRPAR